MRRRSCGAAVAHVATGDAHGARVGVRKLHQRDRGVCRCHPRPRDELRLDRERDRGDGSTRETFRDRVDSIRRHRARMLSIPRDAREAIVFDLFDTLVDSRWTVAAHRDPARDATRSARCTDLPAHHPIALKCSRPRGARSSWSGVRATGRGRELPTGDLRADPRRLAVSARSRARERMTQVHMDALGFARTPTTTRGPRATARSLPARFCDRTSARRPRSARSSTARPRRVARSNLTRTSTVCANASEIFESVLRELGVARTRDHSAKPRRRRRGCRRGGLARSDHASSGSGGGAREHRSRRRPGSRTISRRSKA